MLTMPPRHGKSELCSRYFAPWYLGTFPDHRVILAAHEANFAAKWGKLAKNVLDEWGQELFGIQCSGGGKRWNIVGHEGGMVTAGVGGPITGEGSDLLLIDDPFKNPEQALSDTYRQKIWDWYCSTAYTRLHPEGIIVLINTRWNDDDLSGRLLRKAEAEDGEPWTVVNFPAIADEDEYWPDGTTLFRSAGEALWPERWPLPALERIRKETDLFWWNTQYQQQPGQYGSCEWPAEYFGDHIWFDEWPREMGLKAIALDPSKGKDAKKGDYSAIVMIGAGRDPITRRAHYYVDAVVERMPVEQLINRAVQCHLNFRPEVFGLEGNAWQDLLGVIIEEEFARVGARGYLVTIQNNVKKEIRISRLGPRLADGEIRFKRGSRGAELLVKQLKEFPLGRHDDGPDGLEMGIRLFEEYAERKQSDEDMRDYEMYLAMTCDGHPMSRLLTNGF